MKNLIQELLQRHSNNGQASVDGHCYQNTCANQIPGWVRLKATKAVQEDTETANEGNEPGRQ